MSTEKCDIKGCKEIAKHKIDDEGVDVYLCPDHFSEHEAWKARFGKNLEKALKEKKMPEQEIITLEPFREFHIRRIMKEGEVMIPVSDIADAIGMKRGNMSRSLKKAVYKPHKGLIKLRTPGGYQSLVCLSQKGIMDLLLPVLLLRSNSEEVQNRIIDFQRWAKEMMPKELVSPSPFLNQYLPAPELPPSISEIINMNLDLAEIAIKRSGVPKETAQGMAWSLAEAEAPGHLKPLVTAYASYIKAQEKPELKLIPEAMSKDRADYDSHFSIRKIAEILKQPENRLRNILEDRKIIYRANDMWHLTRYGTDFQFGKVFKVMPEYPYRTTERSFIKYAPITIDLLKEELKRNGIVGS